MFYTGDGASRDEHGYIWIKGRVDGKPRIYPVISLPRILIVIVFTRCYQCLGTPSLDSRDRVRTHLAQGCC